MSNGKTVLETPTTPGDNLWISFINSVEKLPVADHFVVSENYKILFTETIFQAPYAGYDHSERAELIAPGTLKISGYDRQMDAYTFYAGDISRHMVFLNGNWLPLYDVARGGDLIQITVNKRSKLASYMLALKTWFSIRALSPPGRKQGQSKIPPSGGRDDRLYHKSNLLMGFRRQVSVNTEP